MTREKIDWNDSKAFDVGFEETREQRLAHIDSFGDNFVANGFNRPEECKLRSIVFGARIHRNSFVQDTGGPGRENTRAPVEKFLAALVKAQEAFEECLDVAKLKSPPGRLNVAHLLTEHTYIENLNDLVEVTNGVLYQGITPKKREPNYAYDEFITIICNACNPKPSARAPFVKLLLACEVVLPRAYRSLTPAAAGDRYDAWVLRAPERQAAFERFALRQPLTLEEFLEESRPYWEPPPADKPGAIRDARIRSKGRRGRASGGRRE